MIRHDHPRAKHISVAIKELNRLRDQLSNINATQFAFPRAAVQISFNFSGIIAFNGVEVFSGCFCLDTSQALGSFRHQLQHDISRQGISEAKCYEIRCAFTFNVREISAIMNSRTKPVVGFPLNSRGTKLIPHSIQLRVWFRVVHSQRRYQIPIDFATADVAQNSVLLFRRSPDLRAVRFCM